MKNVLWNALIAIAVLCGVLFALTACGAEPSAQTNADQSANEQTGDNNQTANATDDVYTVTMAEWETALAGTAFENVTMQETYGERSCTRYFADYSILAIFPDNTYFSKYSKDEYLSLLADQDDDNPLFWIEMIQAKGWYNLAVYNAEEKCYFLTINNALYSVAFKNGKLIRIEVDGGYYSFAAAFVDYGTTQLPIEQHGDYTLCDNGTGWTVLAYDGNESAITVPDSVARKPVTSIYNGVFADHTTLTTITLPDSVTSIGNSAFSGCTGLTSITIPDSVTSIGYDTFFGCTNIQTAAVPTIAIERMPKDNLQTVVLTGGQGIGERAFSGCTSLTSIALPDSVTSIGSSELNKTTKKIRVTLPNGVTSIGDGAFSGCTGLTSITIPDSVTSIGSGAFSGCTAEIVWGDAPGITTIQYEFSGYKGTSFTRPNSVTSIGAYAFYNCTSLTSITIPDSVTSIGENSFNGCRKLIEIYNRSALNITKGSRWNGYVGYYAKNIYTNPINSKLSTDENGYIIYTDGDNKILMGYTGTDATLALPNGITEIYPCAFYNCTSLTSITIPDSVTSIGDSAFYACTGLTSITIPNGVTNIGNYAFYYCTGLTSITIPDGVTSIGWGTFYNCTSLTSITIPDGVTSIDGDAFYDCTSLTSITFGGTKAQWGTIYDLAHESGVWFDRGTGSYTVHCTDGNF